MEHELRSHLLACAAAYAQARGISVATIARLAAGDWRFFERLSDDEKTFTARKYDEIAHWFADNWPAGTPWPADVPRPARQPERAAS